MKKIISIVLVFILIISIGPASVSAHTAFSEYTSDERKYILMKYTNVESTADELFSKPAMLGYWSLIDKIQKNSPFKKLLEIASMLIKEKPDEKDYANVLTNLIALQSVDIAEQVQSQSQYDDLKDAFNYTSDIIQIATDFVGAGEILEEISPIIDAATDGVDVTVDNIEEGKYFEASIKDYTQSKLFLEAVGKYADNAALKKVASSLNKANEELLKNRIKYIINSTENLEYYTTKFFVNNLSFDLLKESDIYKSNKIVEIFVNQGDEIFGLLNHAMSIGKFAYHATMLVGDIGFGTTDTYKRYQEMKIISDVAGAIIEANSQIIISKAGNKDSILADIQTKCEYYKMLISAHARGEYLLYSLLMNDAGLLSDFKVIFDYFKDPEETVENWYATQIGYLTKYYDEFNGMFVFSDDDIPHGLYGEADVPDNAVEFNGHYYCIYDFSSLISDELNTWEIAKEYCEGVNGYLATITSKEENEFLFSYMKEKGYAGAYFGFSDAKDEGNWKWSNEEGVQYTNWHDGKPNTNDLADNYALFLDEYSDGTWIDGDFGNGAVNAGTAFICEWGDYKTASQMMTNSDSSASEERDIVLLLDASGSMSGTPLEETKKASVKFIDTILEKDARIGVVTYNESAERLSDFSVEKNNLMETVEEISDGGDTNIEDGLMEAQNMLQGSTAKKKIIVLMSDGEPNVGKEGEELIEYADELKESGILIYTLGFFEKMEDEKSSAQYLMEQIASGGCHYEVASADDLVFFFGDIADQINGQKYIYVRIACPVDVTVTRDGKKLRSSSKGQVLRTNFGTLTFEENEESKTGQKDSIKVLRLKEGADYDIQITGTGRGNMDYTIGFMDENGDYKDFRRFENVKITNQTVIDTVAAVSDESILNIDNDGDGRYDIKLRAEANGYGEQIKHSIWIYVCICDGILLVFIMILLKLKKRKAAINRRHLYKE